LSRMLLSADLAPGQTVTADVADGQIVLTASSPAPTAA
jgi:ATP-dependent Clp protease ATP-binding subunit ClpC